MRKLLLILFLAPLVVFGQGVWQQNNMEYGHQFKGLKASRALLLPLAETTAGQGRDTGAIYYRLADSSILVWTGSQWRQVTGSGGGSTDSSIYATRYYTQQTFVPYTGATGSVNLGLWGLTTDRFVFNQTPTLAGGERIMRWNDTDGTLDVGMKGGNVTLQVGQEQHNRVRNNTGSTITNGQVVYISGSTGTNATVALAKADASSTSQTTIGIATEDIANGQSGFVTTFGKVRDINTTGLTEGSPVYLSSTVAGGLTSTAPTGDTYPIVVGICERTHAVNGVIFVHIDKEYVRNYELDTAKANIRAQITGGLSEDSVSRQQYLVGTIFNTNTWSSLTGFTANGVTPSIVSNRLEFTGGANTFTQTFDYDRYTDLDYFDMTVRIMAGTKSATSYGMGVGLRSTSSSANKLGVVGAIDMTSNASSGSLYIYTGASNTLVATSTLKLSFSAGDSIVLMTSRADNIVTVSAYNKTTSSLPVSVSYEWLNVLGSQLRPNIGHFAIYNLGGTQTIDSLNIRSSERKNSTLTVVGDSKSDGIWSGLYSKTFAHLLSDYFLTTSLSGGSEGTAEVIQRLPEILELNSKYVLLNIGRNDADLGLTSTQSIANYDTIVNRLTAAGIHVLHLLPLYETVAAQAYLKNHIIATYSASDIIDAKLENYSGTITNVLTSDNTHPNELGNRLIFEAILKSGKLAKAIPKYSDANLQWIKSGTNIYKNDGRVGVGTSSPLSVLHTEANTTNTNALYVKAAASGVSFPLIISADADGRGLIVGRQGIAPGGQGFAGLQINATTTGAIIAGFTNIGAGSAGTLQALGTMQFTSYGAGNLRTDGSGVLSANAGLTGTTLTTAYTATATGITLSTTHHVVNVTADAQTITLPTAVGIAGRQYVIKLTASGTGTVGTTSSQTIDGSTTYSLSAQNKFVTVVSDGANWIIIANN